MKGWNSEKGPAPRAESPGPVPLPAPRPAPGQDYPEKGGGLLGIQWNNSGMVQARHSLIMES